jgi:hypothetical protein
VKVHRSNLMRKMQASSLADLIGMASRLGFSNARNGCKAEGALNQGLDPLRSFLADLPSDQSTPRAPPAIFFQY